jgi:hypothetical protein
LRVKVWVAGSIALSEEFFARMSRDGRITIPKLIVDLLKEDEEESLVGYAFRVNLNRQKSNQLMKTNSEHFSTGLGYLTTSKGLSDTVQLLCPGTPYPFSIELQI